MIAPRYLFLGIGIVSSLFLASIALPLITYTMSIAMFGLLHVFSELAYVRARFGTRLSRRFGLILASLLFCVVVIRLGIMSEVCSQRTGHFLEVAVVLVLSIMAIPIVARNKTASYVTLSLVFLLVFGLALSPSLTLLLLAVLHNWTPVAFMTEAIRPHYRKYLYWSCVLVFLLLPLLILTGYPFQILHNVGWAYPETSVLPAGPLSMQMKAFIPAFLQNNYFALHAFSAVVFAQCMHYATVIHVMPRLLNDAEKRRQKLLWPLVIFLCLLLLAMFFKDFQHARSIYGIASAVHAWLEIPIILIGLVGITSEQQQPEKEGSSIC